MSRSPSAMADFPTRNPIAGRARRTLEAVVTAGIGDWDRARMLPRLIPIGPEEIADESRAGRLAVLRRLAGALRGERVRGRAGHWSYSLDRHIALVQAIAAEHRGFGAEYGASPDVAARPPRAGRAG